MSVEGFLDLGTVQGVPASVSAWEAAWEQYLHYRGDPVDTASQAGLADETFVMGPIFAVVYRVLAGTPLAAAALRDEVHRVRGRVGHAGNREQAHARAAEMLLDGEFTRAARAWDVIASDGHDFAAVRFAHDVYLHVGDAEGRLTSSTRAESAWRDRPGYGFVAGQHAFALEEVGRYDEAEEQGRLALELDPDDLWARHALSHVYESTDNTPAARELLEGSVERWSRQDLFNTHIWWHLALRLLAADDAVGALAIFDEREPHATTAFALCDQTSLLWRLELAGCEGGVRWDELAERWDAVAERHTCAFLDVHAAVAFSRRPDHRGAPRWLAGLAERPGRSSENDTTFEQVVKPLTGAFHHYGAGDRERYIRLVDGLGASIARIGGSTAQRQLITLTRAAAAQARAPR